MWFVLFLLLIEPVHLFFGVWWWIGLPVGLVVGYGLLVLQRGERERAVVRRVWPALIGWLPAAWLVGVFDPVVVTSWAVGGGVLAAVWWRVQSPRSLIRIDGGSRWPWRWHAWKWRNQAVTDLRRVQDVWEWAAQAGGIAGADLTGLHALKDGNYELDVTLPHGVIAKRIKTAELASGLRCMGRIFLSYDADESWFVTIRTSPAVEDPVFEPAEVIA